MKIWRALMVREGESEAVSSGCERFFFPNSGVFSRTSEEHHAVVPINTSRLKSESVPVEYKVVL